MNVSAAAEASIAERHVALPSKSKRLISIDALRGWAAIYVVVYHLALLPNPNLDVPKWLDPLILNGGTGVVLFFILSAFSICYTWHTREGEPEPTLRFYIRRFFRIAPLFYLWILLSCLRDFMLFDVGHSSWKIFLNTSFIFNFFPGEESGIVWASWTIGVEMLFYALFPFIFCALGSWRYAIAFYLFALVVSLAWDHLVQFFPISDQVRAVFTKHSFLYHLPNFALGMVIFFIHEHFMKDEKIDKEWAIILVLLAVFLHGTLIFGRLTVLLAGIYWQGMAYGCLVLGFLISANRLFVNPLFKLWGEMSYSLYLNHPTIIFLLIPVYRHIYTWSVSTTVRYGTALLITLLILTITSFITYRFIEAPAMRLGNWVIRRGELRGC